MAETANNVQEGLHCRSQLLKLCAAQGSILCSLLSSTALGMRRSYAQL